jgi:hypothetical protein
MTSSQPHLRSLRRISGLFVGLLLAACASGVQPPPPPATPGTQCLAELDRRAVEYRPAAIAASSAACTVDNPVSVTRAAIDWDQPGTVSCAFALLVESFEREVVQPAALAHFRQRVRRIRHFGTYSCRKTASGRMSQHAGGRAIDIAGFELEDGSRIMVEQDWRRPGPRRDFLREVANRACGHFGVVLTPDSDRDHHNHLHLDASPYHLCGG